MPVEVSQTMLDVALQQFVDLNIFSCEWDLELNDYVYWMTEENNQNYEAWRKEHQRELEEEV